MMKKPKVTDSIHAKIAKKHVDRLQNMVATPANITLETNSLHNDVVTIPSGTFFQNGQM